MEKILNILLKPQFSMAPELKSGIDICAIFIHQKINIVFLFE